MNRSSCDLEPISVPILNHNSLTTIHHSRWTRFSPKSNFLFGPALSKIVSPSLNCDAILRVEILQEVVCKNKRLHARLACVTLHEGRLPSWIAFRTCLRSHSARNNVDRSGTDLRPPPEAIQVGSIPDRSQKSANVHIQLV